MNNSDKFVFLYYTLIYIYIYTLHDQGQRVDDTNCFIKDLYTLHTPIPHRRMLKKFQHNLEKIDYFML